MGDVYMLHIFELFCDYKYYKFAVIFPIVQYTVYNVHCTVYVEYKYDEVLFIVYIVHCTTFTTQFKY